MKLSSYNVYMTKLIAAMIDPQVRTATAYISPNYTMRFSRVHRHERKNGRSRTFSLTLGKPNYEAREFIKRARRAGEPFPVKKVQLRMWPARKPVPKRKGKKHG